MTHIRDQVESVLTSEGLSTEAIMDALAYRYETFSGASRVARHCRKLVESGLAEEITVKQTESWKRGNVIGWRLKS